MRSSNFYSSETLEISEVKVLETSGVVSDVQIGFGEDIVANSPDLKKYVDLTVYDEDPVELMNEILGAARGLLPNWRPEAGQIETVLSEAFAIRSSSLANSINLCPCCNY